MSEEGILLAGNSKPSPQDRNLAKLLDFFGVSWRTSSIFQFLTDDKLEETSLRLLCSSDALSDLIREIDGKPDRIHQWRERVHSIFVYAGDDIGALGRLAPISRDRSNHELTVTDKLPEFCGVMHGLRIASEASSNEPTFASSPPNGNVEIISSAGGAVFVRVEYHGVPVFLCSSSRIIDVETELPNGIFDVRVHVLQALPAVLYIRWAFPTTSWTAPERNACLTIDDPLLKPSYGFVRYRELLSVMRQHNFSTSIAFIPWNWRRSDPRVIRMFQENPRNYSISVHGCAHTQAEFGSPDSEQLYGKAKRAIAQMRKHESITGLAHDRVMVFPQGVFSEAAMSVLKRTEFIAAANNDTISSDRSPRAISVADVWDTAIMAYSNFALFTRRYPWSGIENFAFDSLLGKPTIIVIHHDFCREHCVRLADFIKQLNALPCRLNWRSLGELIARAYRQRILSPELTQIEMYAKELRIENTSDMRKHYIIRRRESAPSTVAEILIGDNAVAWKEREDRIEFDTELGAGESATIRIRFHELTWPHETPENLNARARTMLRRYLCELRDNYIHKLTSLGSNGRG